MDSDMESHSSAYSDTHLSPIDSPKSSSQLQQLQQQAGVSWKPNHERSVSRLYFSNPQLYRRHIEDLQEIILQTGFAANIIASRRADRSVELSISSDFDDLACPSNFEILYQIIDAIMYALETLANAGFSGTEFNTIQCRADCNVFRVASITEMHLKLLKSLLKNAEKECNSNQDMHLESLQDLKEAALSILNYIGFNELDCLRSNQGHEDLDHSSIVELLLFTVLVIFLGLLVSIQSHSGPVNENLFGGEVNHFQVPLELHYGNRTLSLRVGLYPRRLACLDALVKDHVWVFSCGEEMPPSLKGSIFTSLKDLANLWGPLTLKSNAENEDVFAIQMDGGMILKAAPHNDLVETCHFYTWAELDFDPTGRIYQGFIDITKPLLIRNDNIDGPFQTYSQCHRDHANFVSQKMSLLSSEPSWTADSLSGTLSFSKVLGFSINRGYKRHPGKTLKDEILDEWLFNTPDFPDPSYIDFCSVLEISVCTGHTRRITFCDLLQNESIKEYAQQTLGISEWWIFPDGFVDFWIKASSEEREQVKMILKLVLSKIKGTGVNREGDLQTWDLSTGSRNAGRYLGPNGRKFQFNWSSMVKDSTDVASFAFTTDKCLKSKSLSQGSKSPDPVLFTQLCLTIDYEFGCSSELSFPQQLSIIQGNCTRGVSAPVTSPEELKPPTDQLELKLQALRDKATQRSSREEIQLSSQVRSHSQHMSQTTQQSFTIPSSSSQRKKPGASGPRPPSLKSGLPLVLSGSILHVRNSSGFILGRLKLPMGYREINLNATHTTTIEGEWYKSKTPFPKLKDFAKEKLERLEKTITAGDGEIKVHCSEWIRGGRDWNERVLKCCVT